MHTFLFSVRFYFALNAFCVASVEVFSVEGILTLISIIFLCVGKESFLSMLCMSLNYLKLLKYYRYILI